MRILIANDKFKGSLPAEKAAFHLRNSLERLFPGAISISALSPTAAKGRLWR
ncbi:MAG: hypothetical protein RLY12_740 [Verrucomicrobiota bacterium]|jgi:glycerate kinase